ncbi:MAG: hypothetical protein PHT49_00625 [Desulfovibrionales bacterium]|nr:hypothetical protein [Desulfovibrionales bacterium]
MNLLRKTFSATLLATLLVGCASTYQPKGFTGGYFDTPIDDSTYRVGFEGNAYTDIGTIENFLLLRAAELTIQRGYDWFMLTERDTDTEWHPTYGKGFTTRTAVVKMFKGSRPADVPRTYDAKAVLSGLGSTVRQ